MCYDEETTDEDIKKPTIPSGKQNNRLMYAVGVVCAVGILLMSVGVHFLLNSDDDEN